VIRRNGSILVVDDEEIMREILDALLAREGYHVRLASSAEEGLDLARSLPFDAAIVDVMMPGMDGLAMLEELKKLDEDLPVLMVTAYASVETAITAMKRGAFDYITKPFKNDEVMVVVRNAVERRQLMAENTALRQNLQAQYQKFAGIIGRSPRMKQVFDLIIQAAPSRSTILVTGESGTGKELVARQLHELSRRRTGPFVAVNCAAVVETLLEAELFGIEERTATGVRGRRGKFESADGGTLFLDEVSDLSLSAQAKLLRVIQDLAVERVGGQGTRRVNTRIIAATNRPLSELTARGLFRSDLYYRLSGVEIHVPPLRVRRPDILDLARYFLDRHRHTRDLSLSPQAEEALTLHSWPGNVRELERLMERAVALAQADRIELDDLPPAVRGEYDETLGPALASDESFRAWGSRYAKLVFERCGRNKRRACQVLEISYHTLTAYLHYANKPSHARGRQLPAWVRSASAPRERSEA